jgi:hypothetical protein
MVLQDPLAVCNEPSLIGGRLDLVLHPGSDAPIAVKDVLAKRCPVRQEPAFRPALGPSSLIPFSEQHLGSSLFHTRFPGSEEGSGEKLIGRLWKSNYGVGPAYTSSRQ